MNLKCQKWKIVIIKCQMFPVRFGHCGEWCHHRHWLLRKKLWRGLCPFYFSSSSSWSSAARPRDDGKQVGCKKSLMCPSPSVSFLVCSSSFAVCICRYVEVFPSRSEDVYSRKKTRNSSLPQLNRTASQTSLKTSEGILGIVLSLFVVIDRCWDVYSSKNWHICSIRVP